MAYPGGSAVAINAMKAIVGWQDFSMDEAMTVGQRLMTLERIFNMKRGLTIESDLDISPRLLEALEKGKVRAKQLRLI